MNYLSDNEEDDTWWMYYAEPIIIRDAEFGDSDEWVSVVVMPSTGWQEHYEDFAK